MGKIGKTLLSLGVGAALFGLSAGTGMAGTACPTAEEAKAMLEKTFSNVPIKFNVEKVEKSPIEGLCQIVVGKGLRHNVFYLSPDGRYMVLGKVLDLKERTDLSLKAIAEATKLNKKDMEKLDEYVAFVEGNGKHTVYLISDPDCPYCKKLEKELKELVDSGYLTVKVVMFPLDIHPNAKKRAVAIVCDKKGLTEMIGNYESENLCEQGKKKVEASRKFLIELGARGTPILILPDGKVLQGYRNKEEIKRALEG